MERERERGGRGVEIRSNLNRTASTVLIRRHNYLPVECKGVNESNYKPGRINIFYRVNRIVNRMIILALLSTPHPPASTTCNVIYSFTLEDTRTTAINSSVLTITVLAAISLGNDRGANLIVL